jgi:LCP family protein required for cell wall assembly
VPGRAAGSDAIGPGAEVTAVVQAGGRRRARGDDPEPPDAAGATTRVHVQPRNGAAPDRSERAEMVRRAEREDDHSTRASRIDETLTRLTAAHAGLTLSARDDDDEPPPPRRRIRLTPGRIVAGALALVVLAATTFGWGAKTWLEAGVRDAAALDLESGAIVDAAAQAGDENVLVVGSEPGVPRASGAESTTPRADTIAVTHIPAGGGPVTVVSFPNDLEINRPPCERWDPETASYLDETIRAEARTDLASALDLGGPRCVTRVVQQLSGVAITKYVGMDIDSVRALTDAVGGAAVCVPHPVLDGVLGPVVPDAGTNRIEGVQVADFVRAGDVAGDPSPEYGRVERQQQVLAAVLQQSVSDTALLDVGRLAALRTALGKAVVTEGVGIDELLALALTLHRLDADGVTFAAVPTAEANSRGHAVLRDAEAADLFAAVRSDAPLPSQAGDPGGNSGPSPSDVTVEVFNGSDRSGLAGQVSETLRSLGFGVGDVASAEEPSAQTVIRFSPDQAAAAALLAATVPSATSVPDPGATGVLQLVLGRSFDDVVRAPSEPIALQATTSAPAAQVPSAACS